MWSNRRNEGELRKKQISSLSTYNPTVRELQRDSLFELSISCPTPFTLKIALPAEFPEQAPILSVVPPMTHPWINSAMLVVGHEKILHWSPNSSLGKVVREIEQEFLLHPPRPVTSSQPTDSQPKNIKPLPNRPKPPPPKYDFPGLDKLSNTELEELIQNETKKIEFLEKLTSFSNMTNVKKELEKGNKELADFNLKKEGPIQILKKKLEEEQSFLSKEKAEYDTVLEEYQGWMKKFSPEIVLAKTKKAMVEAENQSDEFSDMFLAKKMNSEEFIEKYRKIRTLYHLRAAKVERLCSDTKFLTGTFAS